MREGERAGRGGAAAVGRGAGPPEAPLNVHPRRHRNSTAVIADIDPFRRVSDTCGHDFGDTVLRGADCIAR
ncbi:MAG TPA: hypothetical protein DD658_10885 [Deltaproteobacteria bacterium]|nr:hypothetical protein [Deltaproteobacteria bacterium]